MKFSSLLSGTLYILLELKNELFHWALKTQCFEVLSMPIFFAKSVHIKAYKDQLF